MDRVKVIELFAGVGGFRLGIEKNKKFNVVWSNQWEPSTNIQHASLVYEAVFGKEGHSNEDISGVKTIDIPNHDMIVGGFPCQDYSVASILKNSKGLLGKKGVLWWEIHRIISEKRNKPKYLLFENVDRLLKSPVKQRGKDFAVMLKSLDDLGYAVEWRVINAGDYGMPQRRRRIFFLCYHRSTAIYKTMVDEKPKDWIFNKGIMAKSFPIKNDLDEVVNFELEGNLVQLTNTFNLGGKISPFQNSGIMISKVVYTKNSISDYRGKYKVLSDIMQNGEVSSDFLISNDEINKWKIEKGALKTERITPDGFKYNYSVGNMSFPDDINKSSRTIITSEGGKSPSRTKHVVMSDRGLRRLTPVELERLNMFPDNHTKLDGITDNKRSFLMGNALVVGVVEKIIKRLSKEIEASTE